MVYVHATREVYAFAARRADADVVAGRVPVEMEDPTKGSGAGPCVLLGHAFSLQFLDAAWKWASTTCSTARGAWRGSTAGCAATLVAVYGVHVPELGALVVGNTLACEALSTGQAARR